MNRCAAAILAGGKSSRMGEDKSSLLLGGRTLLQHMGHILSEAGLEKIYISRADIIADEIPGHGPLSGVHAVLLHAMGHHTHVVFVPVDMPCLTPDVIGKLVHAPTNKTLVHYDSYTMPFQLAVEQQWFELIDRQLRDGGDVSLRHFQSQIEDRLALDAKDLNKNAFRNINTPEEWQNFIEKERISKPASLVPEGLRFIAEDSSPEQEQLQRKSS